MRSLRSTNCDKAVWTTEGRPERVRKTILCFPNLSLSANDPPDSMIQDLLEASFLVWRIGRPDENPAVRPEKIFARRSSSLDSKRSRAPLKPL